MDLEALKSELSGNTLSFGEVNAPRLENIHKFVDVKLLMDKSSFDYYYEVDVNELVKSEMPNDEIESLKEQGWFFSEDGKKLFLYLTKF